jgi:hypothetical protein
MPRVSRGKVSALAVLDVDVHVNLDGGEES